MPEHDYLTPAQAAQRAKVSRPTVSRALKSGDLRGIRDNSGAWRIAPPDLEAWASARSGVQVEQRAHSVQEQNISELYAQLEQARAELANARELIARLEGAAGATAIRLEELSADRDAWRAQAERLAGAAMKEPTDQQGRISRLLNKLKGR